MNRAMLRRVEALQRTSSAFPLPWHVVETPKAAAALDAGPGRPLVIITGVPRSPTDPPTDG